METNDTPHFRPGKDLLPSARCIPTAQDILVNAPLAAAEHHGLPLAVPRELQLHAATDGLRHAERPPKALHLQHLLRRRPLR